MFRRNLTESTIVKEIIFKSIQFFSSSEKAEEDEEGLAL
jgi:hypothetical protein